LTPLGCGNVTSHGRPASTTSPHGSPSTAIASATFRPSNTTMSRSVTNGHTTSRAYRRAA
jgi:hypothetical protein